MKWGSKRLLSIKTDDFKHIPMVFILTASPFLINVFSFENGFVCLITMWMTHTNNKLSNWAIAYAGEAMKVTTKEKCSKVLKINPLMKEVPLKFF